MARTSARRAAAVALAAAMLLSACGDDSDDTLTGTVVEDGLGCSILSVDRPAEAPEAPTPEAGAEVTEVATEELVEADEAACDTSIKPYLTLDMMGVKASDGTQFTSTYGAERPVTVQVGQGQLINGLETGIAGLKVGGRRQITIPAAEAYGAEGYPAQGIGPDEDLVFVVDLVSVTDSAVYCNENQGIPPAPEGVEGGADKPTEAIEMPVRPYEELEVTTVRESTGEVVEEGDDVLVDYVGISCASGQQFDTSWDRGEPLTGNAGGEGLIEGFSKGLVGTRVGELRRIDIPADMAYGDDALTFLIEVVEIVPPTEEGGGEDGGTTTTAADGEPPTTAAEGDAPTSDGEEAPTTAPDAGGDDDATTTTAAGGGSAGSEDGEG